MPTSVVEGRWDDALPPGLPRAAPQIFRALRSEGTCSVRDWSNLRYRGVKDNNNPEWNSLWSAASEVDFAVKQARPGNEATFLATSDSMEIKLRQLASHVHYTRTGDLTAATQMLAIKPPGSSTDVAPRWLVEDVTAFSKLEHHRDP